MKKTKEQNKETKGYTATKHHNYKTKKGKIAKGCELCVKGEKLVLFVTGICGNGCSYCPVSDEKNLHDVIFANERRITKDSELIEEAKIMRATGAGITGGDPLAVMKRTTHYIKLLKKEFGKKFHIHLYTPLLRVTEENLKKLREAGLDEIRFHPRLEEKKEWEKIRLARKYSWNVGVEVPAIPGKEKELKELLTYLKKEELVDFINLNEFEYADNKVFEKNNMKIEPKNPSSYAVKGSQELALKLLSHANKIGLPVHFCTAKSKDAVQLAKRIKRRAEKAKKPYDEVDEEGLLFRGAIYDKWSIAEAGYQKTINNLPEKEKKKSINRLRYLRKKIINEWEVPEELIEIDKERLRILTTPAVAMTVAEDLNKTIALVKEYPTHDCFIVEADIIKKRKEE